MPSLRSTPAYRNPGWFLALPAVLIALLLAWATRRADPRHQAPRRVLMAVLPGTEAGVLEPGQQQALALLLKDVMELNGGLAVTQTPMLPAPGDRIAGREGWVLAFTGYRRGTDLELRAWMGPLAELPASPELAISAAAPPAQAMGELLSRLSPVALKEDRPGILVPRNPAAFWPLLEAMAEFGRSARSEEALTLLAESEAGAPGCATPAILRGQIEAFRAVERITPSFEALDRARQAYEEALRRAPDHPRASHLLARLLADTGRMKEALILARRLSRAHPHTHPSYQTLAYVGRNAGLLSLVEAGSTGSREILLDPRHPPRFQIGLLYLGRWDEFEASLWRKSAEPAEPFDAVILFHLGYLELLRGRRDQALAHLRRLRQEGRAYPRYLKLGEIFRLTLEGDSRQALKRLNELDRELDGLRGADGEFTFNLAEAYALLGDREGAFDLAGRALAQGFACTRWYEESPLMAPMKGAPRWEALLQNLRERQARFERQFPVSDFPT